MNYNWMDRASEREQENKWKNIHIVFDLEKKLTH